MATSKSGTETPKGKVAPRRYARPQVTSQRLVGQVYGVSCSQVTGCSPRSCSPDCHTCGKC